MRLHELPRGAKIYGLGLNSDDSDVVIFDHVDGMYSVCTYKDEALGDAVIHLSASMPVKKIKGGYIFDAAVDKQEGAEHGSK